MNLTRKKNRYKRVSDTSRHPHRSSWRNIRYVGMFGLDSISKAEKWNNVDISDFTGWRAPQRGREYTPLDFPNGGGGRSLTIVYGNAEIIFTANTCVEMHDMYCNDFSFPLSSFWSSFYRGWRCEFFQSEKSQVKKSLASLLYFAKTRFNVYPHITKIFNT